MTHHRLHLRCLATAALASAVVLGATGVPAQAHDGDKGDRGGRGHHSGHAHGHHGHGHGPWNSRGNRITLIEEVTAVLDAAGVEVDGDGARVGRDRDDLIVLSLGTGRGHGGKGWGRGGRDEDDERDARRRGGSRDDSGTLTFTSDLGSTEWSDFEVEKEDDLVLVTADVDGTEDVPVLALVRTEDDDTDDGDTDDHGWHDRGGSRGWSTAELLLTEGSATALAGVTGSDELAAGEVFGTFGGCGR